MSFDKKSNVGETVAKESIADLVVHEHYERRFMNHEYIFQQDHSGSKIFDSQNLELQLIR
jgi:hypothetical protein